MARRNPLSFRLPAETTDKIDAIAEARGGLSKTRVMILAVDRLHREVCGRRRPDERPVRRRDGKIRQGGD
jgi:hypothetical protein